MEERVVSRYVPPFATANSQVTRDFAGINESYDSFPGIARDREQILLEMEIYRNNLIKRASASW